MKKQNHHKLSRIAKSKITINYPESASMDFFYKGLKNEFETAVVNEPSVFEPLKVYCITLYLIRIQERKYRSRFEMSQFSRRNLYMLPFFAHSTNLNEMQRY